MSVLAGGGCGEDGHLSIVGAVTVDRTGPQPTVDGTRGEHADRTSWWPNDHPRLLVNRLLGCRGLASAAHEANLPPFRRQQSHYVKQGVVVDGITLATRLAS